MVSDRQTLSANGQTTWVYVTGAARVVISGTFGSGTAQIQTKDPAENAIDVVDGAFTTAADKVLVFPPGSRNAVRVDLSGSTTPALVVWTQSG